MDSVTAFYTLIILGLAVWALIRTFSIEAKFRDKIRHLEEALQGKAPPPEPRDVAAQTARPASAPPAQSIQAAKPYEPQASAPGITYKTPSITVHAPATSAQLKQLYARLTGGNIFVRIGVLVLFFGIAFLLKYASEHHRLPPQVRLTGAAVTACVLMLLGWRLRRRNPGYALVLQGGGIGVLYLAIFASLRLYHLLPGNLVFLLLCVVVAGGTVLAVAQDSLWLAIMSVLGGFLAPVLASTGEGSHIVLFSYYLVLNAGILAIAFYRSWRGLNVLGFVCTFIIASAWGALRYQPELFASTEPFLVAFFLMYTGIALLYALRQSVRLGYYADGTLIFGTPLVGFGLQSAMVHDWRYALAYSAIALSLFYMALAVLIHRLRPGKLRVLTEAFLALGVGFGTLAIPFALDAYWTSAAWALEGAGIAWSGMRQRRTPLLASGLLLQLAGGSAFLLHDASAVAALMPVLNTETLGILLIAVAGLFSAWYLDRSSQQSDNAIASQCGPLSLFMLVWGVLWWAHGGLEEAARLAHGDPVAHLQGVLLFATASLLLFSACGRALRWPALSMLAMLQTPVMLIALLVLAAFDAHPLQGWGWLGWPSALVTSFIVLYHLENHQGARPALTPWHAVNVLVAVAVLTWECSWRLQAPHDAIWQPPVAGVLPALALLVFATRPRRWLDWPIDCFFAAYTGWAALGMAVFLWFWLMLGNTQTDSNGVVFAYIPLLNPLDAAQLIVLAAFALWVLALRRRTAMFSSASLPTHAIGFIALCMGFAAFACLNGMLIRALCYWLPLPFQWDSLVDSQIVQMSLSILWTLCAVGLMVSAARRRWRAVWFAGAALMTLEMIKLFALDLSSAGSLERIVSFIVVGGLLLLIGYFSPLPPAAKVSTG